MGLGTREGKGNLKHRSAFAFTGRRYRYRRRLGSLSGYGNAYEAYRDLEVDGWFG